MAFYGYHNFDDFRHDYRAKFGKQPYVSPSHTARWWGRPWLWYVSSDWAIRARGAKWTKEQLDESHGKLKVFKEWWAKQIWKVDDQANFTIMIVPHGRPGANYRDAVPEPSWDVYRVMLSLSTALMLRLQEWYRSWPYVIRWHFCHFYARLPATCHPQ